MPRAYSPRLSTVHLMARLLTVPGVESVRTLPPTRSRRQTLLRLVTQNSNQDLTLPKAREWLKAVTFCPVHQLPEEYVIDPYQADINAKLIFVWLCPECEQERADDI